MLHTVTIAALLHAAHLTSDISTGRAQQEPRQDYFPLSSQRIPLLFSFLPSTSCGIVEELESPFSWCCKLAGSTEEEP